MDDREFLISKGWALLQKSDALGFVQTRIWRDPVTGAEVTVEATSVCVGIQRARDVEREEAAEALVYAHARAAAITKDWAKSAWPKLAAEAVADFRKWRASDRDAAAKVARVEALLATWREDQRIDATVVADEVAKALKGEG